MRRAAGALLGALARGPTRPPGTQSRRDAAAHRIHSALLAGVAAGVAGPDHLTEVLHYALRATRGALGYDSALLFLVPNGDAGRPEGRRLRLVAGAGAVPEGTGGEAYEQRADGGLIGRAVMNNEVVVANDAPSDPDFQPLPGVEATRSELCVPLRLDGGVVGALAVTSNRRNAFDEHDVRTVSTLADQLAMAVARSRLSREQAARTAELARLKAFSEGVVQGIREGIVVTDADGVITFANRHFEKMLGYNGGTLVGRHWQGLVPPEWRESLPDQRDRPGRTEMRLVTQDGRELAVQTSSQPRWSDDRFDGAILLFTDITERVRAEAVSRALGEAGMALQSAGSEAAVYDTLRREAERSGVRVIVTTLDEQGDTIALRFASLDEGGLRVVSRALGVALDGVQVAVSLAPTLARVIAEGKPAFVPQPRALVETLLPPAARHLAPGIVRRLRLGPTTHVPMLLASRPIGLVSVSHPAMTERDQAAAWAFANQVATAVDRGRLHTETERRSQKLEVLAEAAQRLAATADVAELATGIAEQVLRVFDADAATLYVHDEASHRLELASAPGYSPAERKVMEATAWSRHPAWVVRNRQSLLAGDTAQDPRIVYIGSRPRFSSVMYAPLNIEGGRCVGALGVSSRHLYAWKPGDLQLLSTLSDQVAVAVANGLRVRDADRRALQLERVSRAGRNIATHLTVPELLHHSVEEAAKAFGVARATVLLLDDEGNVAQAAHCPPGAPVLELEPEDQPWLAGLRYAVAVRDLRDTRDLGGLEIRLVERGVHSMIVAPLLAQQRVFGGLFLYAMDGEAGFGRSAQDLAQITADQMAVALQNARLYQTAVDAQRRTEAVVLSSFTAMLTVDTVGRVRDANPAAAQLLGAPVEALRGRLLDTALGTDLWLDPEGPISAARRKGTVVTPREYHLSLARGRREREVLLGVAPLPDGYLVSMADITRLKELDRLKTELIANVSHELRSPLASIKAYTELLLDGLVPNEDTHAQFLTIIDNEADRLGQCISNLLDLARVEAEGYVLRRERFGVIGLLDDVISAVAVRAKSRGVRLDVQPPADDVELWGDRALLFSCLKNLVDNAAKYGAEGGTVEVRCTVGDDGLVVDVTDDGPGIAPDDLARVFEKFYRVPAPGRHRVEGSGLGLVIARQAARVHGGDIKVQSTVGRGSTFSLTLPVPMIEPTPAPPRGTGHPQE